MEFSENPLISIIVPSYNQGEFIENCILSVLGQSFESWELIIQDGKSSDSTALICKKYSSLDSRIRFFSESDSGFADAVNKAFYKCHGKLIGIQSSDDFYANEKVFYEVSTLYKEYPYLNVITGKVLHVNHELKNIPTLSPLKESGFLQAETIFTLKDHFSQSATFFSYDRAKHVGGLEPALDIVADTDFWIRMTNYYPVKQNVIYRTSQVWGCVTIHPAQRTSTLSEFVRGRAIMAIKHLKDENFDLGQQIKFEQAVSLVEYGMRYFEYFNLDYSLFDRFYLELFSTPFPVRRRIKRYIRLFPFLKKYFYRNNKYKSSSIEKLDKCSSGCSVNWF